MKKKQHKQRKLRKCELGIRTKSFNKGHRSILTNKGLMPFCDATAQWFGIE